MKPNQTNTPKEVNIEELAMIVCEITRCILLGVQLMNLAKEIYGSLPNEYKQERNKPQLLLGVGVTGNQIKST